MAPPRANQVFYADVYHPIQAGSIDGTDSAPHDHGITRALIASSSGIYDPAPDPKAVGDPYCTIFVGRLSRSTTEDTLQSVMSKYGKVKSLRLVRHIVTGASRGYAFVEFETEKDYMRAYEVAHHINIDGSQIIVDFNRQQLMPGWIPRRFGGGLGGRKESGQLRFGGRERPFRAPLIIDDEKLRELKEHGLPLPPAGRYMSRYQVPAPPRRKADKDNHRSRADVAGAEGRNEPRSRHSRHYPSDDEHHYRHEQQQRQQQQQHHHHHSSRHYPSDEEQQQQQHREGRHEHHHHRRYSSEDHRNDHGSRGTARVSERHSRKEESRYHSSRCSAGEEGTNVAEYRETRQQEQRQQQQLEQLQKQQQPTSDSRKRSNSHEDNTRQQQQQQEQEQQEQQQQEQQQQEQQHQKRRREEAYHRKVDDRSGKTR